MGHHDNNALNTPFNPLLWLFSFVFGFQARKNLEKNGIWTRNLTEEIPCIQE